MPRITIDTATDTPEALRRTAEFIMMVADLYAGDERPAPIQPGELFPHAPDAPLAPPAPFIPGIPLPPPAPALLELDPAAVFGQPPIQSASAATAPASSTAISTSAPAAASPVPPPPPAASGDVDATGCPWDKRIHAESKNKVADGSWRKRRNLAAGVLESVMREIFPTAPGAPLAPSPSSPAPAIAAPLEGEFIPAAALVPPPPPVLVPAPPAPFAGVPPPPPGIPAPVLSGAPSFRDLMQAITRTTQSGKMAAADVTALCKSHGVDTLAALNARPDLIPGIMAEVNRRAA